jgi:hypothetical protein
MWSLRLGGQKENHLPDHWKSNMAKQDADILDRYRRDARLSHEELWLRYFELGGMSTGLQLEAFLFGALEPTAHDHDVIAQALNERFSELGGDHPVPYAEDQLDVSAKP